VAFYRSEARLLEHVQRIRHIPATIVRDGTTSCARQPAPGICIARGPEADLRIVPDAGHSAFEPGNVHELVLATDRYRSR